MHGVGENSNFLKNQAQIYISWFTEGCALKKAKEKNNNKSNINFLAPKMF